MAYSEGNAYISVYDWVDNFDLFEFPCIFRLGSAKTGNHNWSARLWLKEKIYMYIINKKIQKSDRCSQMLVV